MMLTLAEDETYFFDADAAGRAIRFIETFCRHYEGRHAGSPFLLHALQRRIVSDIFGWKLKSNGYRRFTDVYFEAAVGAGKSPLLAAIGLYGLMADGEPAAQVYSLASSYGQARVVFDCAKRFARQHRELERRLDIVDREIRHRASGSTWQIVSGKGPGAGCKPSMILGDEVHQWGGAGAYQDLRDRMFKRRQPLMIVATNAGKSRASFCWTLREKAVAVLDGNGDPSLYPVIWQADESDQTDDPHAWSKANPLIGTTIAEASVRQYALEAMADPEDEMNFRRLYLGVWPKNGASQWLDLAAWDACCTDQPPPADAPLYVGLDLSQGDDLCAAAYVYPTPEGFHLDAEFWLPHLTAEHYIEKDGIPYREWCEAGCIHLLEEPTINSSVHQKIAAAVLERIKAPHSAEKPRSDAPKPKVRELKAVCYDRYRADETIAALEAAGAVCVPQPQGYSLSPGCNELERRTKERSIRITANPVLRWCAENTTVKQDDRGNIWPVKPNAKGNYKGKRGLKIDGITAAVTALTQARKHSFPAVKTQWKGNICLA